MSRLSSVFRSFVKPRRALRIGAMLALALAMGLQPALAATFTVDTASDTQDANPGNGTCADAGNACSLRAAIEEANALAGADVITLPAGTYTLTAGSELLITSQITINGAGAGSTIVQANVTPFVSLYRALRVDPTGSATLNELTIRNSGCGTCAATGGGIVNAGILILNDSSVSKNQADVGGGGISNSGTLTLNSSIISDNKAVMSSSGGGVYNSGTVASITNSILSGNSAITNGGGIFNNGAITTLNNTSFSGNSASSAGGGIHNRATIGTLSHSTFSGNSAPSGGGIANGDGMVLATITTISNTTFSGNSATGGMGIGGGIYNIGGNSSIGTINNSTFSGNSATSSGGIWNSGTITTLSNTIIANNPTGGNCAGTAPTTSTADFTDSTGCFSGWTTTIVPGTHYSTTLADNGCMTPLPDGNCVQTFALLSVGMPPLGINTSVGGAATDERGFAASSTRDIGAYEYIANLPATPTGLSATPAGQTQVNLAWSDVATNETGYKVQRSLAGVGMWTLLTTTGPGAGGLGSYSDTTALCGTAYDYRVKATNTGGDSASSNTANATTDPCGAPAIGVTPTPFNFGSVAVGSNSSQTFTVENTGTADLTLGSTSAVSVTGAGFSTTGGTCANSTLLATGATCTVIVKFTPSAAGSFSGSLVVASDAASGSGTVGLSGAGTMGTHAPTTLKSPKNGAAVIKQPVKLTWKAAKKPLTGYHIQINTQSDFQGTSYADQDILPKKPLFATSGLPFGIYYWHVAVNDATGTSAYSPTFSFEVTILKAPKKGKLKQSLTPKFAWQPTKGATYELEIFTNPADPGGSHAVEVPPLTKPGYPVPKATPLQSHTTYFWRVRVNGGAWTLPWSFTTK